MMSDKQQRVIEAAYDVFLRYGYARTTMGDLAKAAGLSRPALYLVFPCKENIFSAVIEWASARTLHAIRASTRPEWPLEAKLLHALELSVGQGYDLIKTHPDAEDLLAMHTAVPAVEASYARLAEYLAGLMNEAAEHAGLLVTAQELARALLASMRGFKLVARDGQDLRRLMAIQVAMAISALGLSSRVLTA